MSTVREHGAFIALARLFIAFPGAYVVGTPDLGGAALGYASDGWEVFPLLPRDKRPALSAHRPGDPLRGICKGECGRDGHGFYDATADLLQVARWWEMNPSFNIGARVPAGVIVVDIDPRNGGDVSLGTYEAEHGALPATLTCVTGRGDGGQHRYYAAAARPGSKLCDGVDIKSYDSGYVVLPPSVHPDSGQPYRWVDVEADVAPLIGVRPREQRASDHTGSPAPASGSSRTRYIAAAIAGEATAVASALPGGRNNQLNLSAFKLGQLVAGLRLDPDDVIAALTYAAQLAGLQAPEIADTIASGLRAGFRHPRCQP